MQMVDSRSRVNRCCLNMKDQRGYFMLLRGLNHPLSWTTSLATRESLLQVQRLLDPFSWKPVYHCQSWTFTKCSIINISVFIRCPSTFALINLLTIFQFFFGANNPQVSGGLCCRLDRRAWWMTAVLLENLSSWIEILASWGAVMLKYVTISFYHY